MSGWGEQQRSSVRPSDLSAHERARLQALDPPPRAQAGRRRRRGELPVLIVVAVALALVIRALLVQAYFIPSGSMRPTLEVGDRVLVEKVTYRLRRPERGEVVVFERPGQAPRGGLVPRLRELLEGLGLVAPSEDIDLIKRIVGLPGETLELRDGAVHIDGRRLDEPYARADRSDFGPAEIPAGHYFMLGDNRASSDDSRHTLGPVPRDRLVGRAFVRVWPLRRITTDLQALRDCRGWPAWAILAPTAPRGVSSCDPSPALGRPEAGAP